MDSGGCFIRIQIVFYKTLIGNNFINFSGKKHTIFIELCMNNTLLIRKPKVIQHPAK